MLTDEVSVYLITVNYTQASQEIIRRGSVCLSLGADCELDETWLLVLWGTSWGTSEAGSVWGSLGGIWRISQSLILWVRVLGSSPFLGPWRRLDGASMNTISIRRQRLRVIHKIIQAAYFRNLGSDNNARLTEKSTRNRFRHLSYINTSTYF